MEIGSDDDFKAIGTGSNAMYSIIFTICICKYKYLNIIRDFATCSMRCSRQATACKAFKFDKSTKMCTIGTIKALQHWILAFQHFSDTFFCIKYSAQFKITT